MEINKECGVAFNLEEQIYSLDCLKSNLMMIYYGMSQDTLGEDRYAVLSCADMLGVIMERFKEIEKMYSDEKK
jgi:hypothetical protein